MKKLILLYIYCSLWTHASEFSNWQREESKKILNFIAEGLIEFPTRFETHPGDAYNGLSEIMMLTLGDVGNCAEVLMQHNIHPFSYYLQRTDVRQSPYLIFRFGHFSYTQGFKHISKAVWEAVSADNLKDTDYALAIFAAYDEEDIPKALRKSNLFFGVKL